MASLEGKKAPAFNLDGSDGKKHSLEDYKGQDHSALFLSQGRHTGLHQGSVRLSRPKRVA